MRIRPRIESLLGTSESIRWPESQSVRKASGTESLGTMRMEVNCELIQGMWINLRGRAVVLYMGVCD